MSDHSAGADEWIEIAKDGSVSATPAARARLADDRGRWRPLAVSGDLLVFARTGRADRPERGIHFVGAIEGTEALLGALHFLAMGQESGALYIESDGAQRVLYLHRGVLLSARSNRVQDRLGPILVAEGLVTDAQIDECMGEAGESDLLGRALLRRGYLNNHQIYEALRRQTQEIFAKTMTVESGVYYLVKPLDMTEVPAMLHLDVQELLFEGLRRSDELKHLRSIVPSDDIVLRPTGAEAVGDLSEDAGRLRARLDGRHSLAEHFAELDVDVLAGVKAAAELIERSLAEEGEGGSEGAHGAADEDAASRRARAVVAPYQEAMRLVLSEIAPGDGEGRRELVWTFLHSTESYAELLRDMAVREDGTLDVEALIARASGQGEAGAALLRRCLHDLLFFLLFEVGQRSEHELFDRLHREVAEILARGASAGGGE